MMREVCVVIPVYKESMSRVEKASLVQVVEVLKVHEFVLVAPEELDLTVYQDVFEQKGVTFIVFRFAESFFNGIEGYNRLMLSKQFYDSFLNYEYMLIYQLDAWVFKDELLHWCRRGYDYIGSPMIDDFSSENMKYTSGGNGGFSLRRVSFFRMLLHERRIMTLRQMLDKSHGLVAYVCCVVKWACNWHNSGIYYISKKLDQGFNEDVVISKLLLGTTCVPKMPSHEVSAHFAIERYPTKVFNEHGCCIPFGCHAFAKYEWNVFWNKYIYID